MNWLVVLWYLIPAILLLFLVFPVNLEVRASYNPLLNKGVVSLFLFKKQIFYYMVSLHPGYIELSNEKETKYQNIEFSSQQFAVVEEFMKQIRDKVKLKKFYVFYNIGAGDAFLSAMLCGALNQILTQSFLRLKQEKPTASFCVFDTISYNRQTCEVAIVSSLSISFFDIVYSFIYSVIITKGKK